MLVPPSAAPTFAENKIGVVGHIADDLVCLGVADDRPARNLDDQIFPPLAAAARALPVLPVRRGIFALIAEVHQGGKIVVDAKDDIAALSAVAAVGSARGNVFLPMEGHSAVSAVSGLNVNSYFIYKHAFSPFRCSS